MGKAGIAFAVGLTWMGCATSRTKDRLSQDLIEASRRGDATVVDQLIRAGADVNAVDAEGWTPYLAAAVEGNWKVMKMLQAKGCKTDPGF
ncbi:MAG: ankyrin repeat domain-containing protein [Fibrobacteres bacterium]|jgi:ankyrin repeat protein|nr:ankyrin repeat domain-containing protein [Fibrobacterota bacterium]